MGEKMKRYNKNLKIYLTLILFLFSFFFFLFSCKNSTSPSTITLSGTVTLEDTTDYSGVKVMIFEPVEIDTALTNLNQRYPGIGVEINQRTEFFWREHTPIAETTTDKNGHWEIKVNGSGPYHIVVQKDGYGWRCMYDRMEGEHNIFLKKAIIWSGVIDSNVVVPEGSFVEVLSNTIFNIGTNLIIEPFTIIEM
ncbi:MAG: hypothetical protein D6732_24070, partial [Methanobacteriota archaeon]